MQRMNNAGASLTPFILRKKSATTKYRYKEEEEKPFSPNGFLSSLPIRRKSKNFANDGGGEQKAVRVINRGELTGSGREVGNAGRSEGDMQAVVVPAADDSRDGLLPIAQAHPKSGGGGRVVTGGDGIGPKEIGGRGTAAAHGEGGAGANDEGVAP